MTNIMRNNTLDYKKIAELTDICVAESVREFIESLVVQKIKRASFEEFKEAKSIRILTTWELIVFEVFNNDIVNTERMKLAHINTIVNWYDVDDSVDKGRTIAKLQELEEECAGWKESSRLNDEELEQQNKRYAETIENIKNRIPIKYEREMELSASLVGIADEIEDLYKALESFRNE